MSIKINVCCPQCNFSNETFYEFISKNELLYCMNCSLVFTVKVSKPEEEEIDFGTYDNTVEIENYGSQL